MKNLMYLLILTTLSSCSGYYYRASPHYVPLNTQKGELKANVGINNAQLGYSTSDHFSVYTSGYQSSNIGSSVWDLSSVEEKEGKNTYADKSYEINLGGSYFLKHNQLVYEVLFGAGYGKFDLHHSIYSMPNNYEFTMHSDKYNLFIQPTIGIKADKYIELALSAKISQQHLFNIENSLNWGGYKPRETGDSYFFDRESANLYFFEPGLTFRLGFEHIKLQTQVFPVFNLNETNIKYREFSVFLGVFIDIGTLKK